MIAMCFALEAINAVWSSVGTMFSTRSTNSVLCMLSALRRICVQCNGKASDWNTLNCWRASCTNTRNTADGLKSSGPQTIRMISVQSFRVLHSINNVPYDSPFVVIILIFISNEREKNIQFPLSVEVFFPSKNILYFLWMATQNYFQRMCNESEWTSNGKDLYRTGILQIAKCALRMKVIVLNQIEKSRANVLH